MRAITFSNTDESKRAILKLVGKSVDAAGYIIQEKTGERVVSPGGEEVRLKDFAGIRKGSEIIITNDLPSLLEQSEYISA